MKHHSKNRNEFWTHFRTEQRWNGGLMCSARETSDSIRRNGAENIILKLNFKNIGMLFQRLYFLHCTVMQCQKKWLFLKPINEQTAKMSWELDFVWHRNTLPVSDWWIWFVDGTLLHGVGKEPACFSPVILILSDRRGLVDFLITLCGNKLREGVQTVNSTTICNCRCSSSSSSSSASSCRATLSPLWARQEEDVLENRM